MLVNMRSIAAAAAVISGFAAAQNAAAAPRCTGNVIACQVSGVFGSTPISGPDPLELAGEAVQRHSLRLRDPEANKNGIGLCRILSGRVEGHSQISRDRRAAPNRNQHGLHCGAAVYRPGRDRDAWVPTKHLKGGR